MSNHVTKGEILLAIDGHDGAGKTTLARRLAVQIGGVYVRPFGGPNGRKLLELADSGAVDHANEEALAMVRDAINSVDARIKVFDRHWMTVFTLVPERLWATWFPLPPTTLCFSDLETTHSRLDYRDEASQTASWHEHYLVAYSALAARFNTNVIRTDVFGEDQALAQATAWSRPFLEREP